MARPGSRTTAAVTATFSEAMDPATIGASTFELRTAGGALVPAAVSYNALTNVATLTPSAALTGLATYTATVTVGVKDLAGNALAAPKVWSFTTVSTDTTPPTVTATTPADGATGVATTAAVTATFSEAMDPATIGASTFELRTAGGALVPAAVSYNALTNVATLTPSAALTGLATYTATVTVGVKDLAGNALAAPKVWSFTTVSTDTTPPTVTATTPADGATGVATTAAVTATFSEAMDPATIGASTFELRTAGGALVPAAVSYNALTNVATLTPSAALTGLATYTATVTVGVKDLAGNALAAPKVWSFTTVSTDTTPPTVTATTPASGATGVSVTAAVTATFSEAMDPATIGASTFELRTAGGALVPAAVSYNALTNVATLTPSAALTGLATYTATVTVGVKDLAGNALAAPKVWSFTTVSTDTTPPTVTATTPADGATGVATTAAVTATFSEAMDPATIGASTFELRTAGGALVPAAVSYNALTNVATLTPSAALTGLASYTATVTVGVKDLAGNALAAPKVWSFTTVSTDTTPPTVTATTPADGATGVATTAAVTATFSEAMDPATIGASTFELRTAGGALVPAAVSYNALTNVATLTPSAALTGLATYTATVTVGVKDLAGNALAAPKVWSFTTVSTDTTPPTVTATTPASGATGVSVTAAVTATFSEAMDPATIGASTFELRTAGGALVPAAVSYNALTNVATLTPSAALTGLATYTATVTVGVKDLAGNALAAPKVWSFTTVSTDTTPPTVTATTPANGATGVSVTAAVTATFSEAMDPATIGASTFELRTAGGALVPAAVSYNEATLVATLTPGVALGPLTTYTATVKGGVTEPRMKDLAGNALGANGTWTFTTVAAPTVTATSPASGATGVSPTATVTATFSKAMDAATINTSTFELRDPTSSVLAATVTYNPTSRIATLTPSSTLGAGKVYTATVHGGSTDPRVKDSSGIALAADRVWTFTIETTPPTVTAISPASGATGVSVTANVTATFSEAMDPATIGENTFELRDPANDLVPAVVTYNPTSRVATLNPTPTLAAATTYTVTVKGGATDPRVKDVAGNALAVNRTWTFTTEAAPTVTATSPASGATGVSPTANVTATFSKAMDAATINASTFELRDPSSAVLPATVTYNATSRVATLNPTATLGAGVVYTATVHGGSTDPPVKDSAGIALATDRVWTFTIETTPPTVTAISPASGATGVSRTANVTATFSEAMDPATISTSTFELRDPAGTLVPAAVTYNATSRLATLNPNSSLAATTTYTVTVKGGAVDPRVKDVAGNALAVNRTWPFTTR